MWKSAQRPRERRRATFSTAPPQRSYWGRAGWQLWPNLSWCTWETERQVWVASHMFLCADDESWCRITWMFFFFLNFLIFCNTCDSKKKNYNSKKKKMSVTFIILVMMLATEVTCACLCVCACVRSKVSRFRGSVKRICGPCARASYCLYCRLGDVLHSTLLSRQCTQAFVIIFSDSSINHVALVYNSAPLKCGLDHRINLILFYISFWPFTHIVQRLEFPSLRSR